MDIHHGGRLRPEQLGFLLPVIHRHLTEAARAVRVGLGDLILLAGEFAVNLVAGVGVLVLIETADQVALFVVACVGVRVLLDPARQLAGLGVA